MSANQCPRCRGAAQLPSHEQLVRMLQILVPAHGTEDIAGLATFLEVANAFCHACRDLRCAELEAYTLQALALERRGATPEEIEMVLRARLAQQEES